MTQDSMFSIKNKREVISLTENIEDQDVYSSPDYKKSRRAYIAECTFEYFVSLLVSDAYLANLLRHMGIGDAMIGIISTPG